MKRYWKEDSDKIDWRCRNKAGAGKENHKAHFSRCGNRFAPEDEAKAAILMAMNRLPAYRDELIRRQAELLVGDMKRIDALMERSREQEADIEQRIKDVPEKDTDQLNYLEGQILRLQAERDKLIVERAYHANQETQVRLLIELVDEMKARETGEAVCSPDETTAACWEYDDFFRRTKADMDGFLSPDGRVNRFVDSAVIRYLKNITVQDDGYDVNFKAGVTVRIGCEDISVAA